MKSNLRIVLSVFVIAAFTVFLNANNTVALTKNAGTNKAKVTKAKSIAKKTTLPKAKVKATETVISTSTETAISTSTVSAVVVANTKKKLLIKVKTITKKKVLPKAKPIAKKKASSYTKKTSVTKKRAVRKNNRSATARSLSNDNNGELLDWWTSASKVYDRGDNAVVIDIATGKSFTVKRTMGTNHADVEALTSDDTEIIKSIWGGFSWDRRPVIVSVDGRRIAASMTAMPHAGLDSEPVYKNVSNRSAGFGNGMNLDVIKGNGMSGHMDIHFLSSTRHKDGKSDLGHQKNVLIAAGR